VSSLLRTKDIDRLIAAAEAPERRLRKTLGPWSLTALGIGAVIGSGIFILTGTAAAGETLSFHSILHAPVLDCCATAACGFHHRAAGRRSGHLALVPAHGAGLRFAALCYAELASMIPIAGSAYTYAYATLGEIVRLDGGLAVDLEYAVSNMAVAVGFSAHFNDILDSLFGLRLPPH
jgi:APA family basic amino acid/polyamine antiporter